MNYFLTQILANQTLISANNSKILATIRVRFAEISVQKRLLR